VFADTSAPASYVSDRQQKESGSQRLEADALRMKDPPWMRLSDGGSMTTVTALPILALGIGANAAIFALVNWMLL
jgi:hypothetical protein